MADTIAATHSKKLTTQELNAQRIVIARVRDYDSRAHGLDLEQQRPARGAKRDTAADESLRR